MKNLIKLSLISSLTLLVLTGCYDVFQMTTVLNQKFDEMHKQHAVHRVQPGVTVTDWYVMHDHLHAKSPERQRRTGVETHHRWSQYHHYGNVLLFDTVSGEIWVSEKNPRVWNSLSCPYDTQSDKVMI